MSFSDEKAAAYVKSHMRIVELPTSFQAHQIACIDGRLKDEAPLVTIPGGAIGIVGMIVAAIERDLLREWAQFDPGRADILKKGLPFPQMVAFFEKYFGGMSCHTDDGLHGIHNDLAFAGCGHAKLLLTDERYRLGPESTQALFSYARDLKARHNAGDPKVVCPTYRGHHQEVAVIRIKQVRCSRVISLPPAVGKTSVFVINEGMSVHVLQEVVLAFHKHFISVFEQVGVSHSELSSYVKALYHRHVRLSVSKLAKGLPVYDAEWDDEKMIVRRSRLQF